MFIIMFWLLSKSLSLTTFCHIKFNKRDMHVSLVINLKYNSINNMKIFFLKNLRDKQPS